MKKLIINIPLFVIGMVALMLGFFGISGYIHIDTGVGTFQNILLEICLMICGLYTSFNGMVRALMGNAELFEKKIN